MYFVYVLRSSKTGKLYTGITSDLEKRVREHNSGRNFSTMSGRPWDIIHYEVVSDSKIARIREKYLKSGAGREKISKLLTCGGPASARRWRAPAGKMADAG